MCRCATRHQTCNTRNIAVKLSTCRRRRPPGRRRRRRFLGRRRRRGGRRADAFGDVARGRRFVDGGRLRCRRRRRRRCGGRRRGGLRRFRRFGAAFDGAAHAELQETYLLDVAIVFFMIIILDKKKQETLHRF